MPFLYTYTSCCFIFKINSLLHLRVNVCIVLLLLNGNERMSENSKKMLMKLKESPLAYFTQPMHPKDVQRIESFMTIKAGNRHVFEKLEPEDI